MKSKTFTQCDKLIRDWADKEKCLLHSRTLNFYVKHGILVEKVHDVSSFRARKWLKPYKDFFPDERAQAKFDFDKDLPKSMNCSFYGKTVESIRNILNIELVKKVDDN